MQKKYFQNTKKGKVAVEIEIEQIEQTGTRQNVEIIFRSVSLSAQFSQETSPKCKGDILKKRHI